MATNDIQDQAETEKGNVHTELPTRKDTITAGGVSALILWVTFLLITGAGDTTSFWFIATAVVGVFGAIGGAFAKSKMAAYIAGVIGAFLCIGLLFLLVVMTMA